MEGAVPEPTPSPIEPEVEDRIPLEPPQVVHALHNYIIGRAVERVVLYRAKDGRQRCAVVVEGGAYLLMAPKDPDILLTIVREPDGT
jgi:hypothetical protein